ncbi:MAG: hypothetical protein ACHQPI_07300 [Thermoanaerobaculia bacterium]
MTNASLSSDILIPRPASEVFEWVRQEGRLPGRVLAEAPGERIVFAHEGVRGWLPVGDVIGEYFLEPSGDGVRLHLNVWAPLPDGDLSPKIRSLLEGWVSGTLAARAAELSTIHRAA